MNQFLEDAKKYYDDSVTNRRYFHHNAELAFDLPLTRAYVTEKLKEYGYADVKECGGGLTCTVGSGEPCILLRGDMDALPMDELTDLPYKSDHTACHSCGHDFHTSSLLTAARILKDHESELKGTVKFMFQPAEEKLAGCKAMIEDGILQNPKVDVAFAQHVAVGPSNGGDNTAGKFSYCVKNAMTSADALYIHVHGKTAHGSAPETGVNAMAVAANIVIALQQLRTLEVSDDETCIITVGVLNSGVAENVVPEEALIRMAFRTFNNDLRKYLDQRVTEIAEGYAKAWRAEVTIERPLKASPLIVDEEFQKEVVEAASEIADPVQIPPNKGTEDFAYMCDEIPTAIVWPGAGDPKDGKHVYSLHNPHNDMDEGVLIYAPAIYANVAYKWLEKHGK